MIDKISEISGWAVTSLLSIIALVQSYKANKLSKKANKLSKKSNELASETADDVKKDYMPIVKLVDEIECKSKAVEELCDEITFDFYGRIVCDEESSQIILDEEEECIPICFKIKNIGKGIIRQITVTSILICYENKKSFDTKLNNGFETDIILYEPECNCSQELTLREEEEIGINILFPESEYRCAIQDLEEGIKNNNLLVIMELEIDSTNNSSYSQKSLWCNFIDGRAANGSFSSAEPYDKNKVKAKK